MPRKGFRKREENASSLGAWKAWKRTVPKDSLERKEKLKAKGSNEA